MKNKVLIILLALLVSLGATSALAETNTVTSTVTGTTTVDKTPPTASAPNVMINNQESVHAFVDKKTGEVYKPASWRGPAKHVRFDLRLIKDRELLHNPKFTDWAGGYLYMR